MKEQYTEEEMKAAFDKCDGCMSCGWHGSWSELGWGADFELTDNKKFPNEYHAGCSNPEVEDRYDHRGYYIYPEHSKVK